MRLADTSEYNAHLVLVTITRATPLLAVAHANVLENSHVCAKCECMANLVPFTAFYYVHRFETSHLHISLFRMAPAQFFLRKISLLILEYFNLALYTITKRQFISITITSIKSLF